MAGATLCAVLLLVIAIVHYSFGRRGSRVGATLLTLTLMASVGFPLAARGWGDPRPLAARGIDLSPLAGAGLEGGHVTILAVDGASLDYIAQRVADGRLPAFGRLLEGGVSLYLETVRPTQPAPVWTSVAAGKYPPQTGVRAAARYEYGPPEGAIELLPDYCFSQALVHFGLLRSAAYHSSAVRARPLWTILSSQRVSAGVVGWPVTAPASPLRGFLITDEFEPGVASAPPRIDGVRRTGRRRSARPQVAGGPLAVHAGSVEDPPLARDAGAARSPSSCATTAAAAARGPLRRHRSRRASLCSRQRRAFAGSGDGEARLAATSIDTCAFPTPRSRRPSTRWGRTTWLVVRLRHGADRISASACSPAFLGQPWAPHEAHRTALPAYGAPMRSGRAASDQSSRRAHRPLSSARPPCRATMDGIARTDLFKPAFTATRPIAFIPTYERRPPGLAGSTGAMPAERGEAGATRDEAVAGLRRAGLGARPGSGRSPSGCADTMPMRRDIPRFGRRCP